MGLDSQPGTPLLQQQRLGGPALFPSEKPQRGWGVTREEVVSRLRGPPRGPSSNPGAQCPFILG